MRMFKVWPLAAFLLPLEAAAFPNILGAWEDIYPDSIASDIQCGLCHQDVVNGGEPWNAYGWAIREEIQGGTNRDQAIANVETDDSDSDDLALENIDEIIRGYQPGWRLGNNNTLFFSNGSTSTNQAPPMALALTDIDFPESIDDPITTPIQDSSTTLTLLKVAEDFDSPLRAVKAPGINGSLFVVEQTGKVFRTDLETGEKTLFMDTSGTLVTPADGCNECGLLGLAFHPNFVQNGLFYTYQSEPDNATPDFTTLLPGLDAVHQTKIVEYSASDPSCNSFVNRRRTILTIDQPQSNHNGGDLVFDDEGALYISLGDGGGASDFGRGHGPLGNGRNSESILGTILRIDPLGRDVGKEYAVPSDNPFVNGPGIDEIYAYGFRNPFRMSFDSVTGELYTGDVGQDDIEEVDLVVKGGNYGWNWKEGSFFFYYYPNPSNPAATIRFVSDVEPPGLPNDLIDPVGEYDHDEGRSITGGYVYRGANINTVLGSDAIAGKYIFADLLGDVFELNLDTQEIKRFPLTAGFSGLITGFGQDADNELYLLTGAGEGSLFKLTEPGDAPSSPNADGESPICPPPPPSEDLCLPIVTADGTTVVICL